VVESEIVTVQAPGAAMAEMVTALGRLGRANERLTDVVSRRSR
jgi:hypothetical protein